jgi:hypothetical protein
MVLSLLTDTLFRKKQSSCLSIFPHLLPPQINALMHDLRGFLFRSRNPWRWSRSVTQELPCAIQETEEQLPEQSSPASVPLFNSRLRVLLDQATIAEKSSVAGHHLYPCTRGVVVAVVHFLVTELPKIIPYYRLRLSMWPLSNNKELLCRFCRVKPGDSLTTGSRYALSPHEGGTRVQHYIT